MPSTGRDSSTTTLAGVYVRICTVLLKPAALTSTLASPEPRLAVVLTQPLSPVDKDEHEGDVTTDATALPL